jgi:hypothetical protein
MTNLIALLIFSQAPLVVTAIYIHRSQKVGGKG